MEPDSESSKNPSRQDQLKPYLKYSGLGFQMIAVLVLAAWGGMALDDRMGNKNPWWTIGLMLLGVTASMYMIIKSVIKK
ncbi:AtpZ/AtpI family protein [Adhaeribacter rhizoryzae]|uniref:AtpZ/AtpI family protein n=1 Tax=Adhaeribacter rhizoryzae TaxID=2607907 RepID=A0A5M6DDN2_9BACT|nr:AtpZ/AtpI family protein [Adhaeribacter rhizoryzae]KAA5545671.1 AtpZ/AtpI family protein [Adhaeribacter rhizoryzae]